MEGNTIYSSKILEVTNKEVLEPTGGRSILLNNILLRKAYWIVHSLNKLHSS